MLSDGKILLCIFQSQFVEKVLGAYRSASPLAVAQHIFFVDFKSFGLPSPTWFNLVRNPVDRFVSRSVYTFHLSCETLDSVLEKTKMIAFCTIQHTSRFPHGFHYLCNTYQSLSFEHSGSITRGKAHATMDTETFCKLILF